MRCCIAHKTFRLFVLPCHPLNCRLLPCKHCLPEIGGGRGPGAPAAVAGRPAQAGGTVSRAAWLVQPEASRIGLWKGQGKGTRLWAGLGWSVPAPHPGSRCPRIQNGPAPRTKPAPAGSPPHFLAHSRTQEPPRTLGTSLRGPDTLATTQPRSATLGRDGSLLPPRLRPHGRLLRCVCGVAG